MNYEEFLRAKAVVAHERGFDGPVNFNPSLKPHAKDIAEWMIRGGNRACFASYGLHKTSIQEQVCEALLDAGKGTSALIVCPLGVRREFVKEQKARGFKRTPVYVATNEDHARAIDAGATVFLTNYERIRDGQLDPRKFAIASLDEASVLRSFGSDTYQNFLPMFEEVPFKFVATATPSPNRLKELIHYAAFLGVMDSGQALTRFFKRDSAKAGNLTLHPHKVQEFRLWCATWAVFIERPSDLGHSDDGYILPDIEFIRHRLPVDHSTAGFDSWGQGKLIRDAAAGLSAAAKEKRDSLKSRVQRVKEIVEAHPDRTWIIWHELEDEWRALKAAIPGFEHITGSGMTIEEREEIVRRFADGELRIFGTKPRLSGSGSNFQDHCYSNIFMSLTYKANDFMQALHRTQRFGQHYKVEAHLVYTESEDPVYDELMRKMREHDELHSAMAALTREYGLNGAKIGAEMQRAIVSSRTEIKGDLFTAVNSDCVFEVALRPENSVDLVVTSIPFGNHYEYCEAYNDMGHTDDDAHFFQQMDYLSPALYRALKPGRMACIHVKDRVMYGSVTGKGMYTFNRFSDKTADHYEKHGFEFCGRITVVTDVVRENNGTYRLSFSENAKDGTKMGCGSSEYILLFRKPQSNKTKSYADEPVINAKPLCRNDDDDLVPYDDDLPTEPGTGYSCARWQLDAHGFWRDSGNRLMAPDELAGLRIDDIRRMWLKHTRNAVYSFPEHVDLAEQMEKRGILPGEFMALEVANPGAPNVWDDITRMWTLNTEQGRKGWEQHVCLATGSLVLTDTGFKPIEDVVEGELVLTHKGRWRPVTASRSTGIRPVIDIRAQGVAALKLTGDHKLWVRKVRDMPGSMANSKKEAKGVTPDWIPAEDTVGSYVNLKLPPAISQDLSDIECWIIGRWLADGHVGTRGDFHVSIGKDKAIEFEKTAEGYFGPSRDGTALQYRLKGLSSQVINILRRCGRGASGKSLTIELISLPINEAKSVLDGYLSGDGHLNKDRNRICASSVSRGLLLGIAMLAQRVHGAVASVYAGRCAGSSVIEGRTVNTKQDWILSFDLPGESDRIKSFVLEDGAWKKVRSAKPAGEAETWCLRVDEDESFTAEGCIVKNCPLQIQIVDRLIERYSNPGDLVLDPFGGLGTVAYRAVTKGRRGYSIELNEQYWRDSVAYCRGAEQSVNQPTLFDFLEPVA